MSKSVSIDPTLKAASFFTARKAVQFCRQNKDAPEYAARFLEDFLAVAPEGVVPKPDAAAIRKLIGDLKARIRPSALPAKDGDLSSFRKEIVEYYIPKQLIDAIVANGGIPKDSVETQIGVGFIDIADYTFLAKFLSPKENQILLNGLYTAFGNVLKKHGGYLNKTEGDSMMFHFGGLIDPKIKDLSSADAMLYIASSLFYTCVDMQRTCFLFNDASPKVIEGLDDEEERKTVEAAFDIIRYMRNDAVMANSFNALFQIRIRIGANIGEVSIGNFGPPGHKHWDVIGIAVIDAKRMESTAPVGGLRISESYYNLLEQNGIVDRYYNEFVQEARNLNGYFREITKDELFYYGSVVLKDKRNVSFRTYSVQVNPGLPESIVDQIILLLQKGDIGADKIVELIKYYRGNKHVIRAIEDLFTEKNINIRKGKMVYYLFPEKYRSSLRIMNGDKSKVELYIDRKYRLFDVLKTLGDYQDRLKLPYRAMDETASFLSFDQYMNQEFQNINELYKKTIKNSIHNTYFFNIIFPLIFKSLKACILEYQASRISEKTADTAEASTLLEELTGTAGESDELEELEKVEIG